MSRDFSRQSFLGAESEQFFSHFLVGVVGLGGGGSQIVQQLAHLGVQNYVVADHDRVAPSNLNRLVGATLLDALLRRRKTRIAHRTIRRLNRRARIIRITKRWQDKQTELRACNVILGCVDSYGEREQLERFCRRFLIPFIDIGMDVLAYEDEFRIVGQVAQSFPGHQCLRCMNIITEPKLRLEAQSYGAAGPRPQVVWPNGVLASTAVGLFVRLVTEWGPKNPTVYLEYNGNDSRMGDSNRLEHVLREKCEHYEGSSVGDPFFKVP